MSQTASATAQQGVPFNPNMEAPTPIDLEDVLSSVTEMVVARAKNAAQVKAAIYQRDVLAQEIEGLRIAVADRDMEIQALRDRLGIPAEGEGVGDPQRGQGDG